MRVLVAGASGVIGRQLLPALADAGHDVIGLASSPPRTQPPPGTRHVVADALDRAALSRAVEKEEPDAVVNMLTAIPAQINPKKLADDFALTNRLRTQGTANLLDAAARVGVRRVVCQGLAYAYDPAGGASADEDTPLWVTPPQPFVPVLDALRELERRTADAGGIVLRLGHLYGPGTIYSAQGSFVQQVKAGSVPLVGGGTATFSFTHTRDAAQAVLGALASEHVGALNIVDDEPAPMSLWLPHLAGLLGAPAPKRAPAFLARFAVGPWGVAFMTALRGADNTKAKKVLDWAPQYPSWRQGFAAELTASPDAGAATP
jgi:nucleoside-diphosphate-sugar epimerase